MYDVTNIILGEKMKKILLTLLTVFLLVGCSSSDATTNVAPKLVLGKNLASLTLNDQHGKSHTLAKDTKTIVFAFNKPSAHTCNDFFVTKDPSYLNDHKVAFVADVSAAPSLIRSMFIMPGLKDFKYTVLILDDKTQAAPFRSGVDTEKIVVVHLNNEKIEKIETITSKEDLEKIVEKN
jgi:hypothetical protein